MRVKIFLAAFVLGAIPLTAAAQATKTASTPPPEFSRFDLYGGYGYLHPVNSDIGNVQYQPINPGAIVSAAAYFNRYIGVQAEGSFFPYTEIGAKTISTPFAATGCQSTIPFALTQATANQTATAGGNTN